MANYGDRAVLVADSDYDSRTSSEDENDIYIDNDYKNDPNYYENRNIEQNRQITTSTVIDEFNQNVPVDKLNFNYLIFYLLGITTMCPWNFFITAEDYWMYKFRNVTANITDLTPMQKSFTSDLTVTAAVSGTAFLILNAIYGYIISLKLKMIGSMMIIFLLFIVTTAFVEVNTDQWQSTFFLLTLATVVIINSFSAVMCGALFGVAGLFPSEFMTAVVSGQSLGGIITALAFIISLTFGLPPKITAFIYFLFGNSIIVISIICYILISKTEFFRYFVYVKTRSLLSLPNTSSNSSTDLDPNALQPSLYSVFSKIYIYVLIEFLVFGVSLSVYPGVTVLIQSQYQGNGHPWNDVYYVPVTNYLIFNSGDYFGRILAGLWQAPKNNPHTILLFSIARFIFIPLFMLSNVQHVYLPTYFSSDVYFIFIMVIFAISNGYFANIAMINVPKIVLQNEKEMASSIMAAALSLGLAVGACVSLVIVQIL